MCCAELAVFTAERLRRGFIQSPHLALGPTPLLESHKNTGTSSAG
jgi:hypothetical protein